jgi:cytochrome c
MGGTMKSFLIVATAAGAMMLATAAHASQELAQKGGCLGCHAIDTKKMGPAFKDVAAKYKGKADAEATLVSKVSAAKGHPKTKATDAEVQSIVKWVLAM